MRNIYFVPIVLLLSACTHKNAVVKNPYPVSAHNIIDKFKNTPVSRAKLSQGASDYLDTTFKHNLFLVRDTVNEIRVDNRGRSYIILGRPKEHSDLKCYFASDRSIDSLKVNQVITVSSASHAALFKSLKLDTAVISVFVVEMAKCRLIRQNTLSN